MTYKTSGALKWTTDQGLHAVVEAWWVDLATPLYGAFIVTDSEGENVAQYDGLGKLMLLPGFRWDGSSGPTVDGAADPVPSAVHDALYWGLRLRKLPWAARRWADDVYYAMLRERGMGRVRAWLRWVGLRWVGGFAAKPKRAKVEVSK